MPISKNYWNKNIPQLPLKQKTFKGSDSVKIGRNYYFGRSLEERLGERVRLVVFRIIPVLFLSIILAPIAIPAFLLSSTYRHTLRRILEVHHKRKFEYVHNSNAFPPSSKSTSVSSTSDSTSTQSDSSNHSNGYAPSTVLPRDVLQSLIFGQLLHNQPLSTVKAQLCSLSKVSKEWKSIANRLQLDLLNSAQIGFKDFNRAYPYIKKNKLNLTTITLELPLKDDDVEYILSSCPKLQTLIIKEPKTGFFSTFEIDKSKKIDPAWLMDLTRNPDRVINKHLNSFPSILPYITSWSLPYSIDAPTSSSPQDALMDLYAKKDLQMKFAPLKNVLSFTNTPFCNLPSPGLNLLGTCRNTQCNNNNQLMAIPKGFSTNQGGNIRSLIAREAHCECCKQEVLYDDINEILIKDALFSIDARSSANDLYIAGIFKVSKDETLQIDIRRLRFMVVRLKPLT